MEQIKSELNEILSHLTTTKRDYESAHLEQIAKAVRRVRDVIRGAVDGDVAKTEPVKKESEEYEVDRIISDRVEDDEKQYLIRWKSFGADDDTWEPVSNLDCSEQIRLYEQKREKAAKTDPKPTRKSTRKPPSKEPTYVINSDEEDHVIISDQEDYKQEEDEEWDDDEMFEQLSTKEEPSMIKYLIQPPKKDELALLKRYFGFSTFRPHQWEIISNVLAGRDQLVVMATGYGKSICFQFPALLTNGLTLCVSPLISLMQDQVARLKSLDIGAAYLGAAQTAKVRTMKEITSGAIRVVYVTPEFCDNQLDQLLTIHQSHPITCIAIDEAHCVSQWGHDFRVSYRNLKRLRTLGADIPILACTATATPEVRADIKQNLRMRNPVETVTDFDRTNISITVIEKNRSKGSSRTPVDDIIDLECVRHESGKYRFDGVTIIYCLSINQCEELNEALYLKGFNVGAYPYHGSRTNKERAEIHDAFSSDRINAIVATIAFGMGVDKRNVRNVIHYGAPKSPEGYYQELGRAGRDGLQSHAFTFWGKRDFSTNQHFLKDLTDPAAQAQAQKNLAAIDRLFKTAGCRRVKLLQHFDVNATSAITGMGNCCDNCKRGSRSSEQNMAPFVNTVFGAINQCNSDSKLVKFIRGSKAKDMEKYANMSFYGAGKTRPESFWADLISQLLVEGWMLKRGNDYVSQAGYRGVYYTLMLEVKARQWRQKYQTDQNGTTFMMEMADHGTSSDKKADAKQLKTSMKQLESDTLPRHEQLDAQFQRRFMRGPWLDEHYPVKSGDEKKAERRLVKKLKNIRAEEAAKHDMKPVNLAGDDDLALLAAVRPSTLAKTAELEGFGAVKCGRMGPLIAAIGTFAEEHELDLDQAVVAETKPKLVSTFDEISPIPLSPIVQGTYDLFKSGQDVKQIEINAKTPRQMIYLHLASAIEHGWSVNCERLKITDKLTAATVDAIRANGDTFPKVNELGATLGINGERTKLCLALVRLFYGLGKCAYQAKTLSPPTKRLKM